MALYQYGFKVCDSLVNIALSGKSKPDLQPISDAGNHRHIESMNPTGWAKASDGQRGLTLKQSSYPALSQACHGERSPTAIDEHLFCRCNR
jgi:hypothetical protein